MDKTNLCQDNPKEEGSKKEEGKCTSNTNSWTSSDQARVAENRFFIFRMMGSIRIPFDSCLEKTDSREDKDEDSSEAAQHVDHSTDVGDLDGEDHGEEEPGGGDHHPPCLLPPQRALLTQH